MAHCNTALQHRVCRIPRPADAQQVAFCLLQKQSKAKLRVNHVALVFGAHERDEQTPHARARTHLGVHFVGLVLGSEIEADRVGEVDVHLVHQLVLLPVLACHHSRPGGGEREGGQGKGARERAGGQERRERDRGYACGGACVWVNAGRWGRRRELAIGLGPQGWCHCHMLKSRVYGIGLGFPVYGVRV